MSQRLKEIKRLHKMKFQQRQKSLRDLLRREGVLRAELAKLDDQERLVNGAAHNEMKSLGADVLWKAWVGRTKAHLNTELAQILVQREKQLKDVRKDFGKLCVSKALIDEQEIAQRKAALGKSLHHILEHFQNKA